MTALLSALATRLAAAIAAHRTAKMTLSDLRRHAYTADLSLAGNPDARRRLADAITELCDAGLIRTPAKGSAWDHTVQPALPTWVQRPPKIRSTEPAPATLPIAWHARLSWAAALVDRGRPTPAELILLKTVNDYLAHGVPRAVVPIRERSYDLLGDEKALDTISRGRLFSEGRLTLADLYCERLPLPIASWPVGAGAATLLVENHTTAHTLARWRPTTGQIGAVIYSAGSQLPQILASLPTDMAGPLYYFGDLDLRGVEIAADGHQRALELGLGPLKPAAGLYRLLLQVGKPMPVKSRVRSPSGPHVYDWLPPSTRTHIEQIIASGDRIAQEATGSDVLAKQDRRTFDVLDDAGS